jgi:hypothetical protein
MLMDEPLPEPESMATKWEAFALQYGPEGVVKLTLRQAWEENREDVVAEWVKRKPGTRPSAWWKWDAPKTLSAKEKRKPPICAAMGCFCRMNSAH